MITIDDPNAFGTGYHYQFPELTAQEEYRAWYYGNFATLLPPSTIDNGFALFNESDRIDVPVLKIASDFYAAAAMAETPASTSDQESVQQWIKENVAMLDRALRRGAFYWSIHGLGVWTAEEGYIRAVDPLAYFRIGEEDQEDALVGHIIAYRYRETEDEGERLVHSQEEPNRVKVMKLIGETSTVQTFAYDGNIIQEALTGIEQSPITAICVAGTGDSWYGSVRTLVSGIISSLTNIDVSINRFTNKPVYIPANVYENIRLSLQDAVKVAPSLAQISAEFNKVVRPSISIDPESEPPMGSAEVLELTGHFESLRTKLDLFFLGSGLPPSSFGIGVGRGESGIAREKAQDAASSRVRAFRGDVSECLPRLAVAAGMPDSEVSFNWVTPPFEDRSKRQEELLNLLNAGVLNAEQVAIALGWEYIGGDGNGSGE